MVGGMVLLAVGGTAAAVKLTQKDADRVEEHTGQSVEEMSEEDLVAAMEQLGIQSIELDDNDRAIIADEASQAPSGADPAPTQAQPSYLDELEQLANLRDRGVISEEEFEAKKKQLLGL
jgi:histidinol phosphatase-like PHP family hydrolase